MKLYSVLDIDTSGFEAGLRAADTSLRVFERSVGTSSAVVKDFATLVGGIGITRLAADALMAGDEMISLQRKLSVVANSLRELAKEQGKTTEGMADGAKVYEDLRKMAISTSTSMKTLEHAWVQMTPVAAALGVEVETVNNMIKGTIGAASLMGTSNQELERAFVALRQILGKNQLQMEELRGQLGEALPTAMLIFAEGLTTIKRRSGEIGQTAKITTVELNQMIQSAQIGGKLAAEAWDEGTKKYQKFADAQSLVMSGQMRVMKTVFETQSGAFFANSGINTAIGTALQMSNKAIDTWLKDQVSNAEAKGKQFVNGLLNFGGGVAKHLDQTADFHSEVATIIGSLANLAVQGSNAFWSVIPPEVREVGLLGLLMYGGKSITTFIGTMSVRMVALAGAVGIGILKSILPDDFFTQIGLRFVEGLKAVKSFIQQAKDELDLIMGPRPGTDAWYTQRSDKKAAALNQEGSGNVGVEYEQNHKNEPKHERKNAYDNMNFLEKGWSKFMHAGTELTMKYEEGKAEYINAYVEQYQKFGENGRILGQIVGETANLFDTVLSETTSVFGLLGDGVKLFEPSVTTEARKFEKAYTAWRIDFQSKVAGAEQVLKEMMGEGGIITDATPTSKLRMNKQERLNAIGGITSAMAQAQADMPENAPAAKIAKIQSDIDKMNLSIKRQDGVSLQDGYAELFGGNKNAYSQYITSQQARKIGTLDDIKGLDTVEATEKLAAALHAASSKLAADIEADVGIRDEDKAMLMDKIGGALRNLADKTGAAIHQAAENEFKRRFGDTIIAEKKSGQVLSSQGDAASVMFKRELANSNPALAENLKQKADLEKGQVESKLLRPEAALHTMSQAEVEKIARANQTEQFNARVMQDEFGLANYGREKVHSQGMSNTQNNMELGMLVGNVGGYRDLVGEGRERQLELSIENSKLELELYEKASYRSALLDQEMTKLRQEEKTLGLQLEVYQMDGHREQVLANEIKKLELETEKLKLETGLYSSAEYQKAMDSSEHSKAKNKAVKTDDEIRRLGTDEKKSDDRVQAVKDIQRATAMTNNETAMMLTREYQLADLERNRADLGKQIADLNNQSLRYQDAGIVARMNERDISTLVNSNAEKLRQIEMETNNERWKAVKHEEALLGLEAERVSLQRQYRDLQDPKYRDKSNENKALQGDVQMMELLNEYSMSFGQYMRTGAANAVRTFTSTLSTGLTQVITGQKKMKDLFKEMTQMIVGGLIKAVVEFGVRMLVATALSALFGQQTQQNSETTVAATGVAAAASLVSIAVTTAAGMVAANMLATAWFPAALFASIATFGGAAVTGTAALIACMGIAKMASMGLGALGGAIGGGAGGDAGGGVAGGGDFATGGDVMMAHDGGMFGGENNATIRDRYSFDRPLRSDEGFALLQHGEMVVPRAQVASTVAMMKMGGIPLPHGVYHNGGLFGMDENYTFRSSDVGTGADHLTDGTVSAMGKGGVQVVNYFDFVEVERHLMRNPNAVLNIMVQDKRNNGVTTKLYKSARR